MNRLFGIFRYLCTLIGKAGIFFRALFDLEMERRIQNFRRVKNDLENIRLYRKGGPVKYAMSVKKFGRQLKNARAGHREPHDPLPRSVQPPSVH